MKILVLNGSPKEKSDTFRMTEAFLKGLNRNGEHEVNVIRVIDKDIAPCQGCFGCWERMDGHCVIEDDQNAILDIYREADIIIWSFPLYCYGMPAPLKALMCKICFNNPDMVCVPETPMLNVPAAAPLADPKLARFEAAGEEYAAALKLSPETVAELESPMIPKEMYIRIVNGEQ